MLRDTLKTLLAAYGPSGNEHTVAETVKGLIASHVDSMRVDAMGNLIQPDSVTTGFPQLLKENGLRRIRFHDLRHSCASLLLKEGVPMKQIQEWLGHSDISTTANIYAHLDSQSKNSSARTMANTLTLPKAPSVKEW